MKCVCKMFAFLFLFYLVFDNCVLTFISSTIFVRHKKVSGLTCPENESVIDGNDVRSVQLCALTCSKISNCNAFCYVQQNESCFGCASNFTSTDDNQLIYSDCFYKQRSSKYKLVEDKREWNKSRIFCDTIGGYLADIKTKEEEMFILNSLISEEDDGFIWIGANDFETAGVYRWQDGTNVSEFYENWKRKQPDGEDEHCVMISKYNDGWFWRDGLCKTKIRSICKFD